MEKLTNRQVWWIDCEDEDREFLCGRLQSLRDAQEYSSPTHLFTKQPSTNPLLNPPTFFACYPITLPEFLTSSFALHIPATPIVDLSLPPKRGRLVGSLPASSIGRVRTLLPSKHRRRVFSPSSSHSRSPLRPSSGSHIGGSNHTSSTTPGPRPPTPPFPPCVQDNDDQQHKRVKNNPQQYDVTGSYLSAAADPPRLLAMINGVAIYTHYFETDTSDIVPNGDPPVFGTLPDCPVLCLCNCTEVWVVSAGLQPGLYFSRYAPLCSVCFDAPSSDMIHMQGRSRGTALER